ncbi:unnamed protein product [Diabrotica balteata]|uniref:RING-CH-type domain-containing protein n=1 Tax=Diabrotica balteata TaxID=107213 RepID=A0A9N9T8V7_DIABA|nr:unnamed protein product [Diabrotica balteata]
MQNGKQEKDLYVTIVFSESTASLLKLSLPHLNHTDPENSRIFLISPSHYKCSKSQVDFKEENTPTTSQSVNSEILFKYQALQEEKEGKPISQDIFLYISSDVGLFSKSNCSSKSNIYEGCYSEDSFKLLNNKSAESISMENSLKSIFEARKIKKLPLLSARSKAHSNKMGTNENELYVALLDSNTNSADHMCRICHGGESIDDLLMPCRCRGTVALVHLKCLERWLKDSQHSHCELCMHHYKIEKSPRYSFIRSIFAYLRAPGPQLKELIFDLVMFSLYTPTAIVSTYNINDDVRKSRKVQCYSKWYDTFAYNCIFSSFWDGGYRFYLLFLGPLHLPETRRSLERLVSQQFVIKSHSSSH